MSCLTEDVKILAADAETEISISATSGIETQQLNLKLRKTKRESLKNFGV